MRLLVDAQYCPGTIINYCNFIAKKGNIDFKLIRERDKNLYLLSSEEFENEVRNGKGYKNLMPIINEMNPSDILITNDVDLASQALAKVTAVINADGLVFTPESLSMITVQEYLAKIQGKLNTEASLILKKRDPELNEQFKQTLIRYLNIIS